MQQNLDLQKATGVDTSKFAKNIDLASLKLDINEVDIDKLKTVLIYLSKISNVIKNNVVKKTVYDKLVTKVNATDTSGFVLKTQFNNNKSVLEKKTNDADKKLLDISVLVQKKQIIMQKSLKLKVKYLVFLG